MSDRRWQPRTRPPKGLVVPVRVDPTGTTGPTRGQARGHAWRSVGHGWFVPVTAPDVPEQRVLEQAVKLPRAGAITGWAACRLHGGTFFDGLGPDGKTVLPVPLAVGPGAGTRASEAVSIDHDRLPSAEVTQEQGIRCTTPERAVFDAMRAAPDLREAVVAMDMAAAAEITSILRMRRYVATRRGWRGVGQVRLALDLASERSASPTETRLRLVWVLDAQLPLPLVNWPVRHLDGSFLGIADLLDPDAGLVGEYDGRDHLTKARRSSDVKREDRMRRAGLEYVTVTSVRPSDHTELAERICAAHERARRNPTTRTWRPVVVDPDDNLDFRLDKRDLSRELDDPDWEPPDISNW